MIHRIFILASAIVLVVGNGSPTAAQEGLRAQSSGTIAGVVVAPDDARLPGARVTMTNVTTKSMLTVVTADKGRYIGSNVLPGEYEVVAVLEGFDRQSARVTVKGGESREVNFKLPLSTVVEAINVVGTLAKESVATSEIRESTARDVGAALSELNGVYQVRKGGIANDVIVQGFQSRNLTVLIDGQRVYGACPNGMDPALFHADFAEVDHLEVAKGPFDVRHAGSLGGVVNVVTRAPGKGLHGSPNLAVGSYGYINPSVTASIGTERLSVLGGFSYRTSDAYRDGSGKRFTSYANYLPGKADGAAFTAVTGWAKSFVSPLAGHSFQLSYTRQSGTDVKYPYLQMDGITDTADRASASYEIALERGLVRAISAKAYYTRVNHWMSDQFRLSSVGMTREYSMGSQADTRTSGGSVELVAGDVAAGVEAYRRNWQIATMMAGMQYAPQYSVPDVTIDHVGVFAEYERHLGDRTSIEAGARLDWAKSAADTAKANTNLYFAYKGTRSTSASDATASGKIRLTHRLGQNLDVFASVGHTERVPDPQERYFALKRSGSDWVGNPDLKPTGNSGVSGGVNLNFHRLVVSGSYYYDFLSNFITVHDQVKVNIVPGVMNAQSRSYENVNARMRSAEATVTYQVTDSLFAGLNLSYTRGTKDTVPAKGITSSNIAEIHPAMGSFSLRYDRSVIFGEIEAHFSGKHVDVDTDLQEEPLPAYGVLNLKAGVQKHNVRLTVALDNALDKLYVDHMSYQRDPFRIGTRVREPGRNLYMNLGYRF